MSRVTVARSYDRAAFPIPSLSTGWFTELPICIADFSSFPLIFSREVATLYETHGRTDKRLPRARLDPESISVIGDPGAALGGRT